MIEVRLCKPAIYKLKILVGGFQYYKSIGVTTKQWWGGVGWGGVGWWDNKIFKVQWGEAKGEGHDF